MFLPMSNDEPGRLEEERRLRAGSLERCKSSTLPAESRVYMGKTSFILPRLFVDPVSFLKKSLASKRIDSVYNRFSNHASHRYLPRLVCGMRVNHAKFGDDGFNYEGSKELLGYK